MRIVTALALLLCVGAARATAQEQEGKLMDRLLKPDMSLQNNAQTKQFNGGGSAPTKTARTKTFHFAQRTRAKSYTGVRNFQTQEFQTRTAAYQSRQSNYGERGAREANAQYSTAGNYAGVRAAADSEKMVNSSEFAASKRPFLVHGKSQKALSAQDRPLTLEQVRELLNKNK